VRVVRGYPPNIAEIRARLKPGPRTVFAYGDVVYSPSSWTLPPDLLAHEAVHSQQQRRAGGPEAWWRRYIDEPQFRLDQEVEAYRAQLAAASPLQRAERRRLLARIVRDLSGPLYGNLVSSDRARALLEAR
jgi:hypothetical protein